MDPLAEPRQQVVVATDFERHFWPPLDVTNRLTYVDHSLFSSKFPPSNSQQKWRLSDALTYSFSSQLFHVSTFLVVFEVNLSENIVPLASSSMTKEK